MKFLMLFLLTADIANAQILISEARQTKTGKVVTVNGLVTATFGDLGFIQDGSGGIAIYKAEATVGDSISITGKLSKYNGMLEVVADSVSILGQGHSVSPKAVDALLDHEGQLVLLNDVKLPPTDLFFYPQRAGILIHNQDTIQYWVDENTDIPGYVIPETTNITGVVGRFGSRLQLLPRSHLDIEGVNIQYSISNNQFRVINWNVEFFGAPRYGPSNDSLQIVNVAKVLGASQPDVVALQEVSSDRAFKTLLSLLPNYEGRCSSRYSYSFDTTDDFPPQKLCFVYNSTTIKVIREKILFRKQFDDHPSDMFASGRLPYVLEIEVMGHEVSLINLHAKSGVDISDYNRRLSDAILLKDSLDRFYNNKDIILLGDLNDDLDQSIVKDLESPYAIFSSNYSCITRSLSDAGWHSTISYDDMIDHQVVTKSLGERNISISILNPFQLVPLYARTTSDHLPVISEFDLTNTITGIDHTDRLQLYPNPTSDLIWFPDNSNIAVTNSLGEIVIKKQGAHPPISLGECAPGLYIVVLEDQLFKLIRN